MNVPTVAERLMRNDAAKIFIAHTLQENITVIQPIDYVNNPTM